MSKILLSLAVLAVGRCHGLNLGTLMPVGLDPSVQMPSFVDNMLKMPPMDQKSLDEITLLIQDAQIKLNSVIPAADQEKMRDALQDCVKEVSPQLKEEVKGQQQKIYDLLPEETRKKVTTPEQFAENAEQILMEVPDETRIKIVNMMQSLAKENMDKEMKNNPELLNRMKAKQDQVIDSLQPDVKNEVKLTQDELSRKMQEIALRASTKNKGNGAFSM